MEIRKERAEYICAIWETCFKLELSVRGHCQLWDSNAPGRGKDFSVEYRCTVSEAVKLTFLPPEAHGKSLILDCIPAK
jgi:hypothetical protein